MAKTIERIVLLHREAGLQRWLVVEFYSFDFGGEREYQNQYMFLTRRGAERFIKKHTWKKVKA